MTAAEVLLQDYDVEIANTRRTLERVPEGKNDWRPHAKSMALGKLAMHCATLPRFGLYLIEDEGMDLAKPKRPHAPLDFISAEHAVEQLDSHAAACRAALAAASDEALATPWRWGEQLISDNARSLTFRQMFFTIWCITRRSLGCTCG
jgi:hypothetical protein